MMVRMMPTTGRSGMKGQRMIKTRLMMPPSIIIRVPAISRKRRVKKPTMRETRRSINMWNLSSRDELALAVAAEI